MKNKVIAIILLLGVVIASPLTVYARTSGGSGIQEKNAVIDVGPGQAAVTFADLGFRETSLVSPFDATRVLFSVPPNWKLSPGGTVQLDYEVNLSGADAALIGSDKNPYGGALQVTFNDQLIGTISLKDLGSKTAQFELPANALTATRQDGRHQLTISLDAQFSCLYNIRAVVTIKPTSSFNLPFQVSSPELNLSRLPAPFHLRNALLPDRTLVVVPDKPEVNELKAALNLMSGFGSIVGETFDFGLVTVGELTKDDAANSNLIFVGRPEQFSPLNDVKFPLAIQNNQFVNLPPESASDGVVEMALSPWNESKVVLLAGGNSVDAVLKAAQAVSSGKILVYQNPALAYVAEVQPLSDSIPVVEDFSLQSLGYQTQTLSGIGLSSVQYLFNASKEQLNAKNATIDLVYYHSGLLDYGFSSFTVELNNQIVSSTAFSKETEQLTTLTLRIPPGILRFGENRLNVSARMLTTTSCDATGFSNPWLTISDQTRFHLPTVLGTSSDAPALLDLKSYPNLFTTHSDLGDVTFVLPKDNPYTWKIAGQMAYHMGQTANPLISNLQAAYADNVPQQVLNESSLIMIGKSSDIPLLLSVNDQLPAPFDFASNTANESNMQVVYRIPKGMNVGYLQLLSSPYNAEKPMLVLSGNNDNGVVLAGDALLQNNLSSQLSGVFAVTNGTQIATGKAFSPFSAVGTLVPADGAVVTTPVPVSASSPVALAAPGWLLPVLALSGIAILVVIVMVLVSALPKRRAMATEAFDAASTSNGNSEDNK